MILEVVALLMIVNGEIKEHRIQESMSECLKGKRVAMRDTKKKVQYQCKEIIYLQGSCKSGSGTIAPSTLGPLQHGQNRCIS